MVEKKGRGSAPPAAASCAVGGCCQSNGNSSPVWRNFPNPDLALAHDRPPLSQGG